jgi:hypothetical protein
MTGARQTIAVIKTFRKYNKNSLERRAGANRSSKGGKYALKLTTNKLDLHYKDQSVNSVQENNSFVEPPTFCLLSIVHGFKNTNNELHRSMNYICLRHRITRLWDTYSVGPVRETEQLYLCPNRNGKRKWKQFRNQTASHNRDVKLVSLAPKYTAGRFNQVCSENR